ncbi:MAG: biotin/lipoyl-binding protein [Oscillospiraceae bacterium]|nr:biotin/lipoyl-binding protein [Oscillospiraceae bacterium]
MLILNKDHIMEIVDSLLEKMTNAKLSKLSIETKDINIHLEKENPANGQTIIQSIPQTAVTAETEIAPAAISAGNQVTSPIVGTFYCSSGPGKEPYVKVGQKVSKGDVLFIIESMKLMNEVQSEFDGTVAEILVSDKQLLEYGQTVMVIS